MNASPSDSVKHQHRYRHHSYCGFVLVCEPQNSKCSYVEFQLQIQFGIVQMRCSVGGHAEIWGIGRDTIVLDQAFPFRSWIAKAKSFDFLNSARISFDAISRIVELQKERHSISAGRTAMVNSLHIWVYHHLKDSAVEGFCHCCSAGGDRV